MSKPRYYWWSYVRAMVRNYPVLKASLEELHQTKVTASYGLGAGGAAGIGRPTEQAAIRELPSTQQREYEAVRRALAFYGDKAYGEELLRFVTLYYWQRRGTIAAISRKLNYDPRTIREWNRNLIKAVARNYGLMDEEESWT